MIFFLEQYSSPTMTQTASDACQNFRRAVVFVAVFVCLVWIFGAHHGSRVFFVPRQTGGQFVLDFLPSVSIGLTKHYRTSGIVLV